MFAFALNDEAAREFAPHREVFTGVGKIKAAYHLLKAIHEKRPGIIINLGTAGSNLFRKGEVVCCTGFIQRDMNAIPLGFDRYETPFSGEPPLLQYGLRLEHLPEAICGTGDSFDTEHHTTDYAVVDMEAFALAYVAQQENIPFLCLKYISDGADGAAAQDWAITVHQAAIALREAMERIS